jgi:Protein kinase domain
MNNPFDSRTLTTDDFRRIRQVFEAALQRPQEQQHEFIKQACGEHTTLRDEVERMLAAERGSSPLLDPIAPRGPRHKFNNVCPSCRTELTASHRFCSFCGASVEAGPGDEGRFRPGTLFAKRYRIVGAVGRGGMGEVFRANDLDLGQAVALKFLNAVQCDERARKSLRNEVRVARQISHRNVCRVYDIGEAEGQLYFSMEYVDGEDLGGLLRRIGRLPSDKALELAHRLCAGLAAAHAQAALHRDLKPSNIMLDTRGEPRIMDFGLAAAIGQIEGLEACSGTPAYMAPEQLAGREASVRTDLYALGLVLYEIFSGKAPFLAKTPAEFLQVREEGRITALTAVVPGLDPAIERAILRCLDPDPGMRPASALELASSLPGGDPLAAALAAGETPSPEMVAAAGSKDGLRPVVATYLLAASAVALTALCFLASKAQMVAQLPLQHSPEFLEEKARVIVHQLGYSAQPQDTASGLERDPGYFPYMQQHASGRDWKQILALPPSPVRYWFRQSSKPWEVDNLVQLPDGSHVRTVTPKSPPPIVPGMVSVSLGLDGTLMRFAAVPEVGASSGPTGDSESRPDWPALFAAAHLDMANFVPVGPESPLPPAADSRLAWTGGLVERPDLKIRVEAATSKSHVVSFETVWPWTEASQHAEVLPTVALLFKLLIGAVAVTLALYNLKIGRADRQGAWRIGWIFFITLLIAFTLEVGLLDVLRLGLPLVLFYAVSFSICYLALEPWVRRRWPQVMITWSRVLSGRWRDPTVGRDMLAGVLCGLVCCLCFTFFAYVQMRVGGPPAGAIPTPAPLYFSLDNLLGARYALAEIATAPLSGISNTLTFLLSLCFVRVLLRNQWAAAGVLAVLMSVLLPAGSPHPVISSFGFLVVIGLGLLLFLRLGYFAYAVEVSIQFLVTSTFLTPNLTAWYGQSSLWALIIISAVALWAFRVSLGGRPLFRSR